MFCIECCCCCCCCAIWALSYSIEKREANASFNWIHRIERYGNLSDIGVACRTRWHEHFVLSIWATHFDCTKITKINETVINTHTNQPTHYGISSCISIWRDWLYIIRTTSGINSVLKRQHFCLSMTRKKKLKQFLRIQRTINIVK